MSDPSKPTFRKIESSQFSGFQELLKDFVDGKLELNKLQEKTSSFVNYSDDTNTWVSSTKRNTDGTFNISIGLQNLPQSQKDLWKWGTITQEQEYIVKVSHEYSHVLVSGFDKDLTDWLDGKGITPNSTSEDYIRLYAFFAQSPRLNGLSAESVYTSQSQNTGNLNMNAYEDMIETISCGLLGKEYFDFRTTQFQTQISNEQKGELWIMVQKVISNFLQ